VHDLRASADTRLELHIDRPSTNAAYRRVSTFLEQLEAEGVHTTFSLSPVDAGGMPRLRYGPRRGPA
jgi:hypothetical protein